jgi:hypothetical protein
MSWLFSRALVAASSPEGYLGGTPFAQLSVMPTAQPFLRNGKTTAFLSHSQFGLMCAHLTAKHGAELLTSYLAAFPVRTSAQQDAESGSTASEADSGAKWRESFARFDRDSRSWKTAQCSLLADSESYSETWPRWGSMRDGECSAQTPPDCLTGANESGLLPTPSGVNGGKNHTMGRVDEWGGSSNPLRGTVIGSLCLPEFEEMVMAWPVTWTALTPLGTDKFRAWQQAHGVCWGLDA